jgi:hypothetical protein
MTSRFTGDYGLTPNEGNDFAVINLISQMGDNPSNPKPAIEAIAVWLANRWMVYNLSDLQFLWHPDTEDCGEHQVWGSTSEGAYLYTSNDCLTVPGYFTAVSKNQGIAIPTDMAMFDDGQATYHLGFKPNAEGKPTFGLIWMNPRSRGYFKSIVLPVIALGSLAFDFSGQLGYAILGLGEAAAATTVSLEIAMVTGMTQLQVAQLVGSAAIGAVTSGGDPVKAVENAAAAYVGGQAGNFVAGAVDSAAAGKIAAAAVTAGARGQDVGQAILIAGAPLAAGAAAGALTTGTRMDPTDYNLGNDVLIGPVDLGVIGEITVDDEALMQFGLNAAALVPDELGILYNVAGQWVEIPAEQYAAEVFAARGPGGGVEILGPDNVVLLTETEVANTANDTDLQTKTLQALSARSGLTAPSAASPTDRPAGLTAPASTTTVGVVTDFAKLAESLTSSFAKIVTTIRQVENGTYGRVPSPYGPVNPYGTLRPQQVGVPVRNVDGSVTVNNGNGTQTKTLPNGQQITTSTSVAGGGGFGGISTNTLLLVGAGLAAALLLRK